MNLITEHLDIWTTAQTPKTNGGRGRGRNTNGQSLYGIKKLRELILELAVRGKLVPQDPNDEPASVLLEKIAKEKARLIKEGKIKKQKPLPEIGEDEKPFELPEGWVWQRVGEIGYTQTGGTPSKNNKSFFGNFVPFIKPGDIYPTYVDYSNEGLSFAGQETLGRTAKKGSILVVCIGTIGKCNSIDRDCSFNQQINAITPYVDATNFVLLTLRSNYFQKIAWERSSSTTISILNKGKWANIIVPFAPLPEQHRIVAKVDELMAICDQLEQHQTDSDATHQILVKTLLAALTKAADQKEFSEVWQRIANHFDTLFTTEQSIEHLKQTILQLAVMGKLVPQDPDDEPASLLLERIAKEKAKLIKEGKIKKQKPLPEIIDEEKPFELPEGWEWARIGDATLFTEYGMSEKTFQGIKGIPVLKMGDIQDGKLILGGQKLVPEAAAGLPSLYLKKWDLLYNRTNSAELVGKTGIYVGPDDAYTFASYLVRIRCYENGVHSRYLNLAMNTPLFRATQIEPHLKQQCGQANVNATVMRNMIVPVSPLAEQHRIVAKVDELMVLCDNLKARLSDARITQVRLADVIAEQAAA